MALSGAHFDCRRRVGGIWNRNKVDGKIFCGLAKTIAGIDHVAIAIHTNLGHDRLADTDGFAFLQCGSVDGTGAGDPDYSFGPIENAPTDNIYPAGTIAMARAGDDAYSNGHQFFIVTADTTLGADSAGGYTIVSRPMVAPSSMYTADDATMVTPSVRSRR